jgi:hypothetical protein
MTLAPDFNDYVLHPRIDYGLGPVKPSFEAKPPLPPVLHPVAPSPKSASGSSAPQTAPAQPAAPMPPLAEAP